jgi:hypothetical protein
VNRCVYRLYGRDDCCDVQILGIYRDEPPDFAPNAHPQSQAKSLEAEHSRHLPILRKPNGLNLAEEGVVDACCGFGVYQTHLCRHVKNSYFRDYDGLNSGDMGKMYVALYPQLNPASNRQVSEKGQSPVRGHAYI